MKYRILNNNPLEFFDTNADLVGSISANGSNLKISATNGVIELGNTASDVQVGTSGTSINWIFLGGATIGAGGTGIINMGQSGDTVNMNVSGVTYQWPSSLVRYTDITATNNQINITTQVPGSIVLGLPNRPVVGQLQLTDVVSSTSNTTGTLVVGGGVGVVGNIYSGGVYITGSGNGITFVDGTRQITAFTGTGIDQTARDTANTSSANTAILFGIQTTQNTNIASADTLARNAYNTANLVASGLITANQNTATLQSQVSIIQGVNTFQNTRISSADATATGAYGIANLAFTGLITANANTAYLQGVNTTQNTWINNTDSVATGAYNTANNALANTGSLVTSNPLTQYIIGNTTPSTSNVTGALVVSGGVGVSGNIFLGVSNTVGSNIATSGSELALGTYGDLYGPVYLRMQNRTGLNGALFDASTSTVNLVDFGFKTRNAQRNIRFETRGGAQKYVTAGDGNEFQFGEWPASGSANIYAAIANSGMIIRTGTPSVSNTTGTLVVNGGVGVTGNLFMSASNTGMETSTSGRLGWTDGYFTRDLTSTYIRFQGSALVVQSGNFFNLGNSFLRGSIGNDSGNNTVVFNTTSPVLIQNTTTSTSTTTGALRVSGGLGVLGSVYADAIYDGGIELLTYFGGVDNTQNTNILNTDSVATGAYGLANASIGINSSQNTNIASADALARNAYITANIGSNFVSTGGTVTGNVTVTKDLTVQGNLSVLGTSTTIYTSTLDVGDSLIYLANNNLTSDVVDIGIIGHYNDGVNAHAGIIRDPNLKEWIFFKGYTPEVQSNNLINIAHPSFAYANLRVDVLRANGGITFPDGTYQTTAGSSVANTNYLQSVNTTQNTNISSADTLARNAYGVANLAFSGLITANQNTATLQSQVAVIQGVDTTQNTNISSADALARNAYVRANSSVSFSTIYVAGQPQVKANVANSGLTFVAGSNMTITTDSSSNTITFSSTASGGGGGSGNANTTGWLPNAVIFASSTGTLSNTANLSFASTTNTFKANAAIVIANNRTSNQATMIYNSTMNSIDFIFS